MDTIRKILSSRLHDQARGTTLSVVYLCMLILLCTILALTTSLGSSLGLGHTSPSTAKAAAPPVRQIAIPYFQNAAVPFNQTAIFWFGSVSSSSNYIDVRMGYNQSELYIDLHIVDRYVWFDSHAQAPNLTTSDTATVYLSTTSNGSSAPDYSAYKFVAQVDWYQARTYYQRAYR